MSTAGKLALRAPSNTSEQKMTPQEPEPQYHLRLEPDELGVTATALRLLVTDEAHEAQIRALAREVLDGLEAEPDERGIVSVALGSKQMKIAHTALRSLFRDLGREQADELEILRRVIDKLPDEHVMRAISLD
jgi:hypothetical protein